MGLGGFFQGQFDEVVNFHDAQVFAAATANGHGAIFNFLIAHNQHERHFLHLGLTNLVTQLFIAQIGFSPQTFFSQLVPDLAGEIISPGSDGKDTHLLRAEPGGESPGEMFGQNADKTLDAAEDSAMKHDGPFFLAVVIHISQVKALRQSEVALNGGALPAAAQSVF